jgi:hypothetical protein
VTCSFRFKEYGDDLLGSHPFEDQLCNILSHTILELRGNQSLQNRCLAGNITFFITIFWKILMFYLCKITDSVTVLNQFLHY